MALLKAFLSHVWNRKPAFKSNHLDCNLSLNFIFVVYKIYLLLIFKVKKYPLWHSVLSFTCILLSASIANSWIEFFLCVVVVGIRQKWQMICNHIWVKYPLKTKLQYVFICLGPPYTKWMHSKFKENNHCLHKHFITVCSRQQ